MPFVTKFTSAIIEQKISVIVKNLYFKLLADNIILSILKKFSLKKIESNIKKDACFLDFLIKKAASIRKVNVTNCSNKTTNSRKDFYLINNKSENNATDKYNLNDLRESIHSGNSNFDVDLILKDDRDYGQNKVFIVIISFYIIAYTQN